MPIIGNFNALDSRSDKGGLRKNFLISERIKKLAYENSLANSYFWGTKRSKKLIK